MLTRIVAIICWGDWFSPAKINGTSLAIHKTMACGEIAFPEEATPTMLAGTDWLSGAVAAAVAATGAGTGAAAVTASGPVTDTLGCPVL